MSTSEDEDVGVEDGAADASDGSGPASYSDSSDEGTPPRPRKVKSRKPTSDEKEAVKPDSIPAEKPADSAEAVSTGPTFFINNTFQESIKHQGGEIPKIGTVTSFSFFGAPPPDVGDEDAGSAAVVEAPDAKVEAEGDGGGTAGFAFFGNAGLLAEQPLAQPVADSSTTASSTAAPRSGGSGGGGRLFSSVVDDDISFSRAGDYAEAEQAWVESRGAMTEDYKKRRRAAKRRRTKLGLHTPR
jgi:hypothetical protein